MIMGKTMLLNQKKSIVISCILRHSSVQSLVNRHKVNNMYIIDKTAQNICLCIGHDHHAKRFNNQYLYGVGNSAMFPCKYIVFKSIRKCI